MMFTMALWLNLSLSAGQTDVEKLLLDNVYIKTIAPFHVASAIGSGCCTMGPFSAMTFDYGWRKAYSVRQKGNTSGYLPPSPLKPNN
jgi:hypothetical protein